MTDNKKLASDISFVREVAERSQAPPIRGVFLYWALAGLLGFALVDFADSYRWVGIYWMVAGPVGFILSAILGIRAARAIGLADRAEGLRHGLHWIGFLAAGVLGLGLVRAGQLTWQGFGSLWVLLLALSYFHGGLHLERRMVPVGLVAGACYLATIWIPSFGWTVAGVAIAAALVSAAFLGVSERELAG